jgi:hypothetical protein
MDAAVELFCPDCQYSLRGIDSGKCPECGLVLDRERLAQSTIPWTYRGEIGRWRAYWRTVRIALREPSKLGNEVARPVNFDDARKFRRTTVLIAAIVPALAIVGGYVVLANEARAAPPMSAGAVAPPHTMLGWVLQTGVVPAAWLGLYLFLLAGSSVASGFFRPKRLPIERQNRAVAISLYAAAPLTLTPLSVFAIAGGVLMLTGNSISTAAPLPFKALIYALAVGMPLAQVVVSFIVLTKMLGRAVPHSTARAWAMATTLPLAWLLLAAIIAVGVPLAYLFVVLVVMSLLA